MTNVVLKGRALLLGDGELRAPERPVRIGTAGGQRDALERGVEHESAAAQAAEVVHDAIARSDGTRSSVVAELFRTRVENGLLGTFGFDPNGDITESPVTILRVARKGSSSAALSVEGGVVERVVRPATSLVGSER